jgi:hypothetical protein
MFSFCFYRIIYYDGDTEEEMKSERSREHKNCFARLTTSQMKTQNFSSVTQAPISLYISEDLTPLASHRTINF